MATLAVFQLCLGCYNKYKLQMSELYSEIITIQSVLNENLEFASLY